LGSVKDTVSTSSIQRFSPVSLPRNLRKFRELLGGIVGKKIWEIMYVIGFDGAELGLALPGKSADPDQPILEDGEDHLGDLGWTMHRGHRKGRSRIESAKATADSEVTKTSIMRLSSAART